MRYLLCFTLVLSTVSASPQAFWLLPNKHAILMGACNMEHSCAIDTAFMSVSYACIFNREDSLRCEIAQLQVGANYTRFHGLNRWQSDSIYTARHRAPMIFFNMSFNGKSKAQNKKSLSFEIIRDRKQGLLDNIHRLAFQDDRVMRYNEQNSELIWKMSEQTRTIGGYLCYEAETSFGGRRWRVWFTPEIPVDAGPWKLAGLPGLILEASDSSNDYQFLFRGIVRKSEPILKYQYDATLVTKKRWLQYERTLHQAPYATLQAAVNTAFYTYDSETNEVISLDDNWSIPYNPIEFE